MPNRYQEELINYYQRKHIHPENFNCPNKMICCNNAYKGNMTETKMSMVGSAYGEQYPKIVVISLDPPSGKKKDDTSKQWEFITPHQRTTEYVSSTHEKDNYAVDRPNPHWSMTQIIVKDIMTIWGYKAQPYSAIVTESYSGHPIENVSAYFAHVNVAKCSMNNEEQRQAPEIVHRLCSDAYLLGELRVLEPDILITQGSTTNKILGKMFRGRELLVSDLPYQERITIGNNDVLWLPMHHPTQQLNKIRNLWSFYEKTLMEWKK